MDKISANLSNNKNVKIDEKKSAEKTQKYLLKDSPEDEVNISNKDGRDNKNHSIIKWAVGAGIAVLGIIVAVKMHKSFKGNASEMSSNSRNKRVQSIDEIIASDPEIIKMSKQYDGIIASLKEQTVASDKAATKSLREAEKAKEMAKTAEERAKKTKIEVNIEINKMNADVERERESVRQSKANYKKMQDEIKNLFEKMNEDREKIWEEFNKKWKENLGSVNNVSRKYTFKLKAESGINIFKIFGKDASGKPIKEVKDLGSVDTITEESVKKAYWALAKKYGPMFNSGTEKEKIEATQNFQKVNSACEDLRAYLKLK